LGRQSTQSCAEGKKYHAFVVSGAASQLLAFLSALRDLRGEQNQWISLGNVTEKAEPYKDNVEVGIN
jgi:hypothetical protein